MISYADFGRLRLSQFLPDADLTPLEDWEYEDASWVGESLGFSEWLRLEQYPDTTGSIALDLSEFPEQAAAAVFHAIGLPLSAGMNREQIVANLGEPAGVLDFVADRRTYEFVLGEEPFQVSCTVLNDGGLCYVTVLRPPNSY